MSLPSFRSKSLLLILTLILAGCDRSRADIPLPEVNEENCKPENTSRIKNEEIRNKYITQCALRSTVTPSKPRGW